MSELIITAKVIAKKDSVHTLKNELLKLIAPTRKEEGCLDYALHQDNDDPALFMFYEIWESPAHFEKHRDSAHFKAYISATDGLIQEKVVNMSSRIG